MFYTDKDRATPIGRHELMVDGRARIEPDVNRLPVVVDHDVYFPVLYVQGYSHSDAGPGHRTPGWIRMAPGVQPVPINSTEYGVVTMDVVDSVPAAHNDSFNGRLIYDTPRPTYPVVVNGSWSA